MRKTIYDFEVNDLAGKAVKLSEYKGKVLLIVNIASKCGLTPQLHELEELYEKYRQKGFEVLAFPSNQFAGQEPLNGKAIDDFCSVNYGVKFKIFQKDNVRGKAAQPLYHFLANETQVLFVKNYPIWNFQKYLIDKDGRVVDWFNPKKSPLDDKITEGIEKCLSQKSVER